MATALELRYRRLEQRRRIDRARITEYDSLVASPADLGNVAALGTSSALTLPAGARLALSCSVGLSAEDVTVNVGGRESFTHPDLAADEVHRGYTGGRQMDVTVTRNAGPAGTLTLYILDPYNRKLAVATATLTP